MRRPHARWPPVPGSRWHADAPAVSLWIWRAAVLHAPAPSRQPNLTLPPAATLIVGTTCCGRGCSSDSGMQACPTQVGERGDCVPQRPAELADLPLEAGLRAATTSHIRAGQRTHWSFKQFRPGVLMLNIAAAGVAPACRTKRGTPDRQPADAASLRSPNAARLKRRIPTGKLVPRQACPKYARVVQNRAGSNLQAVDTTTGGNRWRDSKSADRKVMGVRPPPPGTTLRYSKHII